MGWTTDEFDMGYYRAWYIDVDSIDGELKELIDQYIVEICYADEFYTIQNAKNYIKDYLKSDDEDRKKGAIAEFIIHVFMKKQGYTQECLYKNLEEKSPKKGFDGVYVDSNGIIWYMESKSGSNKSKTHKDKVQEAYRDLKDKFAGNVKNDPWTNALNHAKVVGASNTILNVFRKYSVEYEQHNSLNVEDFNVLPCGTLYKDDSSKVYVAKNIIDDVDSYFKRKNQKGLGVICITQQTISEFEAYLNN